MFSLQQIKEKPFITLLSKSGYVQIYQCTLITKDCLHLVKLWNENTGYITESMCIFRMNKTTFNEKQINNQVIGIDSSLDEVKFTLAELFI